MDAPPGAREVRLTVVAAALCLASSIHAQTLQPEIRLDYLGPHPYSLEPGVGVNLALGYYVRLSAGAGYALPLEPTLAGDRWRADLLARAVLDPFRQQRWALSLGGGLSYRRSRTYLAAILDLEGPTFRRLAPAIQVGVSGGLRVGVVLRRAAAGRR